MSNVFDEIYSRYKVNKLAHAFLFETNNVDKCFDDVVLLIKKLNCDKDFSTTCNAECNLCNLVDKRSLPSFIVIEPEGLLIKKNQVLDLKSRFVGIPVYSKFNSYVIKNCDKLNGSSANTLLKFLEEPIDNVIGFYITDNKENVISTVKSRCQIYSINYDENSNCCDLEFINFIDSLINNDYESSYLLRKEFIENHGERAVLEKNFSLLLEDVLNKITNNSFKDSKLLSTVNRENQVKIIETLKKVLQMIRSNVNIDLVFDTFIFEMSDLNG